VALPPLLPFLAALVATLCFAGVGDAAVWNPDPNFNYYSAWNGAPRHHTLQGCYSNPGGVLNPVFPDGKRTIAGQGDLLTYTRRLCPAHISS